jgi:hypothetical protein
VHKARRKTERHKGGHPGRRAQSRREPVSRGITRSAAGARRHFRPDDPLYIEVSIKAKRPEAAAAQVRAMVVSGQGGAFSLRDLRVTYRHAWSGENGAPSFENPCI